MKKTLHVLAIIAAGAMIMMMTGCASMGKPAGADARALSSSPFVLQKKALMGIIFSEVKIMGRTITFDGNMMTLTKSGGLTYDGPYTIDGSTVSATLEGYRAGHRDEDLALSHPTATVNFTIHRDKKGALFLDASKKNKVELRGFYKQK